MRRNIPTIVLVVVVLVLIVGLNLIFLSEPKQTENELTGDRSSYRASPYGTLAYYTLLEERGRAVTRLERPFTEINSESGPAIATLVVIVPSAERQPTEEEMTALERWVKGGGHLVIIDREIQLKTELGDISTGLPIGTDVHAVAASPFTRGVDDLKLTAFATAVADQKNESTVHFAGLSGALLIDRAAGQGRVTYFTEPYVVQNNGIRERDNLALALNLVDAFDQTGVVAFDEYHHGHGRDAGGGGGLREYIAGTPVPWIIAQLALVGLAVAVTLGARFGRPVPIKTERRTSALEFVSSMANIQRLARASDLAVENVYTSFRARLCRYASLPSNTPIEELARVAAARGQVDAGRLHAILERCEKALAGQQGTPQELVDLVSELRKIEASLKL